MYCDKKKWDAKGKLCVIVPGMLPNVNLGVECCKTGSLNVLDTFLYPASEAVGWKDKLATEHQAKSLKCSVRALTLRMTRMWSITSSEASNSKKIPKKSDKTLTEVFFN